MRWKLHTYLKLVLWSHSSQRSYLLWKRLLLILEALCGPQLCATQMLASGKMVDLIIRLRTQNTYLIISIGRLMRLVESVNPTRIPHKYVAVSWDIMCDNVTKYPCDVTHPFSAPLLIYNLYFVRLCILHQGLYLAWVIPYGIHVESMESIRNSI